MTAAMIRTDQLTAVEWEAARLLSGDLPDWEASTEAVALALAASAAAGRDVMDDIGDDMDAQYVPSGKSGPRMSDYGACNREVWYRESPPEDYTPIPSAYRRAATLGSIIHQAAEGARGRRYPWRRYEYTVTIPGLERPGRVDEYDPITGEVIDDKTAGDYKWTVVGEDGPPDEAWGQGFGYGYALDEMGLPVRTITIIFINRATGLEEHFSRPYDPAIGRVAIQTLIDLAALLATGVQPDRHPDAYSPRVFPCKLCPAVEHCWNYQAAADAGRGPASFTLLGAEPDDPSIVWAATNAIDTAKAATKAAAEAKAAKELLEGLPSGKYGDVEIYRAPHTSVGYKTAYETTAALYVLPEAHRPLDPPEPQKTVTWATAAKLVRAAKRGKKADPAP